MYVNSTLLVLQIDVRFSVADLGSHEQQSRLLTKNLWIRSKEIYLY